MFLFFKIEMFGITDVLHINISKSLKNVFVISIPASYYFAFLYKQRYIIIFTLRTFIPIFYRLSLYFNNRILASQEQKSAKENGEKQKISLLYHPVGKHGI